MKGTKTFNNISDKLKASIPKLEKGKVVVFQMLNGVPNPDPDEKERSKTPFLYGKKNITTNHRIFDKFQMDGAEKEVGGFVDIGCVDRWNGENPEVFRFFMPGMGEYTHFQGKFSLTGGNVKDEELYEILYLSPEREGSPCVDSAVTPLFKILDVKADSKNSMTKFNIYKKALDLVADIKPKKAREVMAALNQPSYQDEDILMAKVSELAKDKPDLFIKVYEDPKSSLKADLKEALDSGVINHDLPTGNVTMGGVMITTLKVDDTNSLLNGLTNWISSAENGEDVIANIRKQFKPKKASV